MKIFILTDQEKYRKGGVNNVLKSTIPLLQSQGLDISQYTIAGLCLHRNKLLKTLPHLLKLLIVTINTILKYARAAKKSDIIHAHGISAWIPTIIISKLFHKISVITLHETEDYTNLPLFFGGGKLAKWIWKFSIRNADYITSVANINPGTRTYTYIPNGVDVRSYDISQDDNTKNVLLVGRLSVEKGIEYFIDASRKILLNHPDAQFKVIAPTPNHYVNIIQKNNIEVCTNPLTLSELKECYQKADIVVLPSLHEAFPLVLLEAMSCGKAVVATNVGGVSDIVVNGKTGYIIEPRNSNELSSRIDDLLSKYETRHMMGMKGRERVEKYFTWDHIISKYLAFYKKIENERNVDKS